MDSPPPATATEFFKLPDDLLRRMAARKEAALFSMAPVMPNVAYTNPKAAAAGAGGVEASGEAQAANKRPAPKKRKAAAGPVGRGGRSGGQQASGRGGGRGKKKKAAAHQQASGRGRGRGKKQKAAAHQQDEVGQKAEEVQDSLTSKLRANEVVGSTPALDESLVNGIVLYNWGGAYGWCRAVVTRYYKKPKTKSKFNFELTYPQKELRNQCLDLNNYGDGAISSWVLVEEGNGMIG